MLPDAQLCWFAAAVFFLLFAHRFIARPAQKFHSKNDCSWLATMSRGELYILSADGRMKHFETFLSDGVFINECALCGPSTWPFIHKKNSFWLHDLCDSLRQSIAARKAKKRKRWTSNLIKFHETFANLFRGIPNLIFASLYASQKRRVAKIVSAP